jgi:hypothetical protein
MPDNMQTARSSQNGFRGVGVVLSSPDPEDLREELLRSEADYVIDDYAVLPENIG